jgi:hypothetical protein
MRRLQGLPDALVVELKYVNVGDKVCVMRLSTPLIILFAHQMSPTFRAAQSTAVLTSSCPPTLLAVFVDRQNVVVPHEGLDLSKYCTGEAAKGESIFC